MLCFYSNQNVNITIIYDTKKKLRFFLLALDLFPNNLWQYAIVSMYILLLFLS